MNVFDENAGEDPEQEPVRFYKAVTDFSQFQTYPDAMLGYMYGLPEAEARRLSHEKPHLIPTAPADLYPRIMQRPGTSAIIAAGAAMQWTWHDSLEPEYKAWPAAVAALAATKIEIGCEHLRMPFPTIAIRLPVDFVQEPGKPVIHSVFATIFRNTAGGSFATTSLDAAPTARSRFLSVRWRNLGEDVPAILSVMIKWKEQGGPFDDDSFFVVSIGLKPGETIEERLQKVEAKSSTLVGTAYVPTMKLMREMLSLAIGVSFMATGRVKKERPIVAPDKKPRHERRRWEKEHDGQKQPVFSVGRDLILPREEGVASPKEAGETGPGEGEGRQLKYGHFRSGHLRFQPYGSRAAPTYDLIFVTPTLVRSDLPLRTKTPSKIEDVGGTRDITDLT